MLPSTPVERSDLWGVVPRLLTIARLSRARGDGNLWTVAKWSRMRVGPSLAEFRIGSRLAWIMNFSPFSVLPLPESRTDSSERLRRESSLPRARSPCCRASGSLVVPLHSQFSHQLAQESYDLVQTVENRNVRILPQNLGELRFLVCRGFQSAFHLSEHPNLFFLFFSPAIYRYLRTESVLNESFAGPVPVTQHAKIIVNIIASDSGREEVTDHFEKRASSLRLLKLLSCQVSNLTFSLTPFLVRL